MDQSALWTFDAKSEVAIPAYSSQLRDVITFVSSDSECTQSLGFKMYSMDLSDFHVPSYGVKRSKVRLIDTIFASEVRMVHIVPFRPHFCVHSDSELKNVLTLRNRELCAEAANSDFVPYVRSPGRPDQTAQDLSWHKNSDPQNPNL